VVEQFVRTVLGIATRAAALVGGRIVLSGSPDEIAPQLHSAYLAGSADGARGAPVRSGYAEVLP
jgi:hypothetical protein